MANGFCSQHEDVQKRLSKVEASCEANKESIILERKTRCKDIKRTETSFDKKIASVELHMENELKAVKKVSYMVLGAIVITWLTVVTTVIIRHW